jgi:hypothetical protein
MDAQPGYLFPTPLERTSPCGVSVVGAFILQPWDAMSLIKADLGSVRGRARSSGSTQTPQQSHPSSPLHEPLHWKAKRDPKADPKAEMLFLQIFSAERRVVGLCWEKSKPKGPKGPVEPDPVKRTTLYPLFTSLCTGELNAITGELNAIRKQKCFLSGSFLQKGVSLGCVGQN